MPLPPAQATLSHGVLPKRASLRKDRAGTATDRRARLVRHAERARARHRDKTAVFGVDAPSREPRRRHQRPTCTSRRSATLERSRAAQHEGVVRAGHAVMPIRPALHELRVETLRLDRCSQIGRATTADAPRDALASAIAVEVDDADPLALRARLVDLVDDRSPHQTLGRDRQACSARRGCPARRGPCGSTAAARCGRTGSRSACRGRGCRRRTCR